MDDPYAQQPNSLFGFIGSNLRTRALGGTALLQARRIRSVRLSMPRSTAQTRSPKPMMISGGSQRPASNSFGECPTKCQTTSTAPTRNSIESLATD